MSKLNKYLKSIAKELEKSALLSEANLSSVAGGVDPILVPLEVWEESMRNAGYDLQEYLKDGDVNFYYRCYLPQDQLPGGVLSARDNYYPVRGADGRLYMQVD